MRLIAMTIVSAKMPTAEPPKITTPKMVEYQLGSRDMTQSKEAKVSVSAKAIEASGAHFFILLVSSRSCVSSCLIEVRQ